MLPILTNVTSQPSRFSKRVVRIRMKFGQKRKLNKIEKLNAKIEEEKKKRGGEKVLLIVQKFFFFYSGSKFSAEILN